MTAAENPDQITSCQDVSTQRNCSVEQPDIPRSHDPLTKNEAALEQAVKDNENNSDSEHLHGPQLYILLSALTLAGFLMMLNASVVATVCESCASSTFISADYKSGHPENHESLPFNRRCRLVWQCLPSF